MFTDYQLLFIFVYDVMIAYNRQKKDTNTSRNSYPSFWFS